MRKFFANEGMIAATTITASMTLALPALRRTGTAAASGGWARTSSWTDMSDPQHGGAAEETARPEDENHDDHDQRDGELELAPDHRDVGPGEVLHDADGKAPDHRAAGARQPAEDGAGESVEQDRDHHVRFEEHHGRDQH